MASHWSRWSWLVVVLCLGWPAAAAGQVIHIEGQVERPGPIDLSKTSLPRTSFRAEMHGGAADFEGVSLFKLLEQAGAPLGKELHGENLALYVLVTAADGYKVLFALAELDPGFGNRTVIIADQRDGKPLDESEGPLRLVAAGEAHAARSARQVVSVAVLSALTQ